MTVRVTRAVAGRRAVLPRMQGVMVLWIRCVGQLADTEIPRLADARLAARWYTIAACSALDQGQWPRVLVEEKGINEMASRALKRILLVGGVLVVTAILLLLSRWVALSSWVWAAFLGSAGLGAFGLYLSDRSDRSMLVTAYLSGAIAGLVALVPPGYLRDEAIALYVLLSVALPLLVISFRDRTRWWALIPAYPLLVISAIVGLSGSGLLSDDLLSAGVAFAIAIPFFLIYARNRRQWWALGPGCALTAAGLCLSFWVPWHSVRSDIMAGDDAAYIAALALLVVGVWILARATRARSTG